MDPVEPHIHSFIVKVWQEVVVGDGDEQGWRGYITHVPSGARRYFEDLADILAFVRPTLVLEATAPAIARDQEAPDVDLIDEVAQVATRTRVGAPGWEEVEMDSSASGLQSLQDQLKAGDSGVNSAEQKATGAQVDLKRKRDAQASLQKTLDEAKASSTAINKMIAASVGPAATSGKIQKDLEAALAKALTPEQQKAIQQVVKDASDRGAALAKTKQDATGNAAGAQKTLDDATAGSAAATSGLAAAQAGLKDLATAIQGLSARLTALSNGVQAALDAKRPGAAYRLNLQLADALTQLAAKVEASGSTSLQRALSDAWADVTKARDTQNKASDDLASAKATLQVADDKLKNHQATTDAWIDDRIASLEQQWAASAQPTGGHAGDKGGASQATQTDQTAGSEPTQQSEPEQTYEATA